MWFIYITHTAFPQNCLLILIQKLFSFSVLGVALTILEPLGPTLPHDHRSGVPDIDFRSSVLLGLLFCVLMYPTK